MKGTHLCNGLTSRCDQKICFVDALELLVAEVIFEANGGLAIRRDVSGGGCCSQPPSNQAQRGSQGLQGEGHGSDNRLAWSLIACRYAGVRCE